MIDIREHGGSFGGGGMPKEIDLSKGEYFPPGGTLEKTLYMGSGTGNQDVLAKYLDPITKDIYHSFYSNSDGNTYQYLYPQGSVQNRKNLGSISGWTTSLGFRRNGKIYRFHGTTLNIMDETTPSTIIATVSVKSISSPYTMYWKDTNTLIYASGLEIVKFDFTTDTQTVLATFSGDYDKSAIGMDSVAGTWWKVTNTSRVVECRNENNQLIFQTGTGGIATGVQTGDQYRNTSYYRTGNTIILLRPWNSILQLYIYNASDMTFISSTNLKSTGATSNRAVVDNKLGKLIWSEGGSPTYLLPIDSVGNIVNDSNIILSDTSSPTFGAEQSKYKLSTDVAFISYGWGDDGLYVYNVGQYVYLSLSKLIKL
jgi:hypothetical protein